MKLAIDVDGVLAVFNNDYAKLIKKYGGPDFPKNGPDWPPCWNWEADVDAGIKKQCWDEITAEGSSFWHDLSPNPTTPHELTLLNNLAKEGHEVFFLTNRMGHNAKLQTEKWLYEYGIDYPTVILVGDKLPLIKLMKIEFFVDDRPETIWEVAAAAKEHRLPVQGRVFLKEMPYNREHRHKESTAVSGIEEALQLAGLVQKEVKLAHSTESR